MNGKPRVAIVILNWNGRALLERFLPFFIRYNSYGADIYVADNASCDDSIAFLRANYPDVRIIENKENYGFALGYNKALEQVDADIFALVNSDIEVTENWMEPLVEEFVKDPTVAAAQPKLLDYKDRERFEYAGAAGGYIDKLGYPYCKGRIFTEVENDRGQYEGTHDIFWATGACLLVRAGVFRKLGGFDPDFFAHLEEIDLCWRIWNYNLKVKYVSRSQVYHIGGATLKQGSSQKTFLNFRNSLYTLVKNLPGYRIPYVIPTRLVLDFIQALRFVGERNYKHIGALLHAHMSFYYHMPRMLGKRKLTPYKQRQYYHTPSIVFSHFIGGKKYFSELSGKRLPENPDK